MVAIEFGRIEEGVSKIGARKAMKLLHDHAINDFTDDFAIRS
jgi:hypothetical protein